MTAARKRPRPADVDQLLGRLAGEERAFLEREFLAPAVGGGSIRVRIGGVACKLAVEPRDFVGYGVFRPASHSQAQLVRNASLAERRSYLRLFPLVRLVVCRRARGGWLATAASFGDGRIALDGLAPLHLAEEVQQFDVVCARFDGGAFWFEEVDPRRDPATAAFLRTALAEPRAPDQLERKGLTAEERAAYEVNYWELAHLAGEEELPEPLRNALHRRRSRKARPNRPEAPDPVAARLQANLTHAGARLIGYLERGDGYRVTFTVEGRQYASSVNKDDLGVQVAGICLSGEDRKFDLASLVGVVREGEQGHGVVRIGGGGGDLDEEHYWRVHPPRRD